MGISETGDVRMRKSLTQKVKSKFKQCKICGAWFTPQGYHIHMKVAHKKRGNKDD